MQQWLAAGDHVDRRIAFIDRREAIGGRQALIENLVWVIDLAATRAGEIAAEQGFEHQDERKALASRQALANHIGADLSHLQNRYSQCTCSLKLMPFAAQPAQDSLVEFGRQLELYIFCDSRQGCQFNRAEAA